MRLEIIDEENVLDTFFGLWVIRKIQSLFVINVNQSKFIPWNAFFRVARSFPAVAPSPTCIPFLPGMPSGIPV